MTVTQEKYKHLRKSIIKRPVNKRISTWGIIRKDKQGLEAKIPKKFSRGKVRQGKMRVCRQIKDKSAHKRLKT